MKSEKEKMLSGEPYDCSDSELQKRWHYAKALLREFNSIDTTDQKGLDQLLHKLLGSRGRNLSITPPFFCDYGENIHIGNNTEINMNCVFLDCNRITIGENVLIAPAVQLLAATHPIRPSERISKNSNETRSMAFCVNESKPITIEDNVWIGGGAIILPGVTIGKGSVIGAGSVVTRDIPSMVVAAGNPCRIIRPIED